MAVCWRVIRDWHNSARSSSSTRWRAEQSYPNMNFSRCKSDRCQSAVCLIATLICARVAAARETTTIAIFICLFPLTLPFPVSLWLCLHTNPQLVRCNLQSYSAVPFAISSAICNCSVGSCWAAIRPAAHWLPIEGNNWSRKTRHQCLEISAQDYTLDYSW